MLRPSASVVVTVRPSGRPALAPSRPRDVGMSSSYGGEFDGTDTAGLIEDRLDALFGRAAGPVMWDVLSAGGGG